MSAVKRARIFRATILFGLLCSVVYFVSYMTRINYAASLAEIVLSMNVSKRLASIGITGSFVTYGAGQLLSGVLGDRIAPRRLIALALLGTVLCNALITVLPSVGMMAAVWCVNGLFQAFMWPPLVRIMAETLREEDYQRVCVWVTVAASIATIVIYILVPLCIQISGWRLTFGITAVMGIATAVLWYVLVPRFRPAADSMSGANSAVAPAGALPADLHIGRLVLVSGLIPIMCAITMQGTLRDGITTWMPSLIAEVFDLGTSVSILTTAILPIFAIISIKATSEFAKRMQNELKASTFIFALGFVSAVLMAVFSGRSPVLSILLMALITSAMHGVNLILIGRLPVRFVKYRCVSTFSGILNACTYVGSAASAYGIAALSDTFGWDVTIITWAAVSFTGTLCCALVIPRWGRFIRDEAV